MSRSAEAAWDDGLLEPEDVDHPGLRELLKNLDKVTPVRSSNSDFRAAWTACCPAHDDKHPSLSIRWQQNGRITLHCFAEGCSRDAILRAAGIEKASVAPPLSMNTEEKIEDTYDYRDENGELVFQMCRFPGKRMRYRRPDGKGGWMWRRGDRRVLYRLPELIAGVAAGEQVFICEGEKDANRLAGLGLCATCNPGGAGKWDKAYSKYLTNADVVLMQDNDDAGARHVSLIARALRGVAKLIRVVLLPGLPEKGDVSDWLGSEHGLQELLAFVETVAPVDALNESIADEIGDDAELKQYGENQHGLWRLRGPNKPPVRLANFTARITRQIIEDDGVEQKTTLDVKTTRQGRTKTFLVTAAEFEEVRWPGEKIDARASITPLTSPREVAYAIKLLSRDMTNAVMYRHTGWRHLEDGTYVYLHSDGAVGPNGRVADLSVRLDGPLSAVALPDPPAGEELRAGVRSAFSLLDVAPHHVMIPLLAAAFRAPLGPAGFSIHLVGQTGTGKTQLAVLIQQFFGASFTWDRLPGNWTSTANAIEGLLFHAKDMVSVVDDLNPRGAQADVQRLHQTADRVFRGAANIAARARMDRDANLRPVKPPRAFLLSTGEEAPTGHSLTARILLIELSKGDVDFEGALTKAQASGRAGEFAACMSGYLQFHAREYAAFAAKQLTLLAELRARATREGHHHRRTPDATANGMLGWLRFLDFALASGAITSAQQAELEKHGWAAFNELARQQLVYQAQENQARLFVALIRDAVQGERAHVSEFSGDAPSDWASCGWRAEQFQDRDVFRPCGPRIGYVEKNGDVFLIKTVAYAVAQELSRNSPHGLTVKVDTLSKRLAEAGLLKGSEQRDDKTYLSVRNRKGGKYEILWWFDRSVFEFYDGELESPPPDPEEDDI